MKRFTKRRTARLTSLIVAAICAAALLVVLPMSAFAYSAERGPAPLASLQESSQSDPQAWETAYKEVLESSKTPIGTLVNPNMKQFSLVDIDGDGTPELITLGDEFVYDHTVYLGNQFFSFQGGSSAGDVFLLSVGSKLTLYDNGILESHQEGTVPLWTYYRVGQGPSLERLFGYGWRGSPEYDYAWFVTTDPGQPIVGRAAVEAKLAEIIGDAKPLKISYVENNEANRALLDNLAQGAFRAYSDVTDATWYSGAVQAVATANLMRGYGGSDAFGVGRSLTRAELAMILWRNAEPEAAAAYDPTNCKNETGMKDVESKTWYTGAANWAVENGVINGYADTNTFGPNDPATFEQMIVIFANYCDKEAASHADEIVLDRFGDASLVSDWARGSMAWAVDQKIVNGNADGTLRPGEQVARERVAVVLTNMMGMDLL